jgi:hypothetical protein
VVLVSFILFFTFSNGKNKKSITTIQYEKLERKIKYINTMTEVEIYSVQSKFNQAKTEYMSLIESLQTSCLGKEQSKECQKAASLNADMQTYLIQMSNLIKKTPRQSISKQKELLDLSAQLNDDMQNLTTLEAEERDLQVFASMNYVNTLAWSLASLTIFILVYQSKK